MPISYLVIVFSTIPMLLAIFAITFLFPDEDNLD